MFLFVVCIESRIDAYKVIRDEKEEAGTWDENAKKEAKEQIFGK